MGGLRFQRGGTVIMMVELLFFPEPWNGGEVCVVVK